MTITDHLCCIGYGLQARASAVSHMVRGHHVHWRAHIDLWTGCTGSIWCEHCPDTSDGASDLGIWSRHWWWLMKIGQMVCGVLGHKELKHPLRYDVPVLTEWYCSRCVAHIQPKSVN